MISKYARPRSEERIDGCPGLNIAESEMTTASQARRSLLAIDELLEVVAADFLFTLCDQNHVYRKLAASLEMRFERLDVQKELAFVVNRAARVDVSVAHCRLEWR